MLQQDGGWKRAHTDVILGEAQYGRLAGEGQQLRLALILADVRERGSLLAFHHGFGRHQEHRMFV